jgi:CheY-like chemotaxis protein
MKYVNELKENAPKILLVDDDPIFRHLIQRYAQKQNVDLITCGSIEQLKNFPSLDTFDVIILDYFLDNFREDFLGTDFAKLAGSTPCLLVSSNDRCVEGSNPWPNSIRKFVSKRTGPITIIASALQLLKNKEVNHVGY